MTSAIQGRLAGLLLVRQEDSNVHGRYIRVGVSYELPSKLLDLARNSWRLEIRGEYERDRRRGLSDFNYLIWHEYYL